MGGWERRGYSHSYSKFIVYKDKTLAYVKLSIGYPAIYPVRDIVYDGPAEAVVMDLDGTSVKSEEFWIWIIEQTMCKILKNSDFTLEAADEPFVSGHSALEHLQYCINKYCPGSRVKDARNYYYDIVETEMENILRGKGHAEAFKTAPGLKEFLYKLKENNVKIELVTSGHYKKAWPEIAAAFRSMNMGDPLDFYDAIITVGTAIKKEQAGTLGELSPKPHP